jgi:hypothetical protein
VRHFAPETTADYNGEGSASMVDAITRVPSRGAPTALIQNHPSVSTRTNLAAIGSNSAHAARGVLVCPSSPMTHGDAWLPRPITHRGPAECTSVGLLVDKPNGIWWPGRRFW